MQQLTSTTSALLSAKLWDTRPVVRSNIERTLNFTNDREHQKILLLTSDLNSNDNMATTTYENVSPDLIWECVST